MKIKFTQLFIRLALVLIVAFFGFSCETAPTSTTETTQKRVIEGPIKAGSPTEAYKSLYEAVKAKDNQRIQQLMSKNTISFAGFAMEQHKQSLEKVLENGMTATTFADSLPEIRDERVKDNFGAVEVFNQKENRWEDLSFILEDGMWKLAVGDLVKGTFKSPGKGQAQAEMDMNNPMMQSQMPTNTDANSNVAVPKEKSKRNPVNTVEVPDENPTKSAANANKK